MSDADPQLYFLRWKTCGTYTDMDSIAKEAGKNLSEKNKKIFVDLCKKHQEKQDEEKQIREKERSKQFDSSKTTSLPTGSDNAEQRYFKRNFKIYFYSSLGLSYNKMLIRTLQDGFQTSSVDQKEAVLVCEKLLLLLDDHPDSNSTKKSFNSNMVAKDHRISIT